MLDRYVIIIIIIITVTFKMKIGRSKNSFATLVATILKAYESYNIDWIIDMIAHKEIVSWRNTIVLH